GLLCFFLSGVLLDCRDPLVDSSYATTGKKSINGVEQFRLLLEEAGDVKEVAYVSRKDFEESDLIVHFEKYPNLELYDQIEEAILGEHYWVEMSSEELLREKE